MSSLRVRLLELARREATFADVHSECIRIASADGHTVAQARRELYEARDNQTLTAEQYRTLERVIETAVVADGGSVESNPAAADRSGVDEVGDDPQEAPTLDSGVFDEEETAARPLSDFTQSDLDRAQWDDASLSNEDLDDENEEPVLAPRAVAPIAPSAELADGDVTDSMNDAVSSMNLADDDATVPRTGASSSAGSGADDDATVIMEGAATSMPPSEDEEDAAVLRTDIRGNTDTDDDATVVMRSGNAATGSDSADDDATVIVGRSDMTHAELFDDATAMDSDAEDKTRILSDDDILDPGAMTAAEQAHPDTSMGDHTWDPGAPTRRGPVIDRVFTSGSMLKDRFRLTDPLGEGGMGTVWKAVDILKLEAEDRNPYVAIKLLQGDFKAHPEAFIALQRESSKQQRLAHPNIATVFDFDREASSNTVFMTMEVMNGSDLADFIKTVPKGGLEFDDAIDLIEQLGAGLDYAHKAGLVHSDLKPGNCFLTNERRVKLLDFGIARASATREDAEGEETKFDPGTLGALTPSYATLEMFQGLPPDPRDDIYAMAIIAHQLLSGKHPYNRRGAPKAMKEGLQVAPLDKLTKRQNRALAQGLAFERENRTGSVEEFLDGMRVKKLNKALIALPIAVVLAVVGAGYAPLMSFLAESERNTIIEAIRVTDPNTIATLVAAAQALEDDGKPEQRDLILRNAAVSEAVITQFEQGGDAGVLRGLELTKDFPEEIRNKLLANERISAVVIGMVQTGDEAKMARGLELAQEFPANIAKDLRQDSRTVDAIFALYEGRLGAAFKPAEKAYDFATARVQVAELKRIYPGLARTRDVEDALVASRDQEIERLTASLTDLLAAGKLLPDADAEDVGDVLTLMRSLRPDSEVLNEPRIAQTYADAANSAIADERYSVAERVLAMGLRYLPDSAELQRLNSEVLVELKRIQDARLASEIESRLGTTWQSLSTLEAVRPLRQDLQQLGEVAPTSSLLSLIQAHISRLFADALLVHTSAGDWRLAQALLLEYAGLIDLSVVESGTRQLHMALTAAGESLPAASEAAVSMREDALADLLNAPESTRSWDLALSVPFKELAALVSPNGPRLLAMRELIAKVSRTQAQTLTAADDYTGASQVLERAARYYRSWPGLAMARESVAAAKVEFERVQKERMRLARIEELKSTLLSQAVANQPDEAATALAALRAELPNDDVFLTEAAPDAIGQSYLRLAAVVAGGNELETALQLADRGLLIAPRLGQLTDARQGYVNALRSRALAAQWIYPAKLAVRLTTAGKGRQAPIDATDVFPGTPDWSVLGGSQPGLPLSATPSLLPTLSAQDSSGVRLAGSNSIRAARMLSPGAAALEPSMAKLLAASVQERLSYAPADIAGAELPLTAYARLYPNGADVLRTAVAVRFSDSFSQAIAAAPEAAAELEAPMSTYRRLFVGSADALRVRLAQDFTAVLRERAATVADMSYLRAAVGAFRTLLPDNAGAMSRAVSTPIARRIVERAQSAPLELSSLRLAIESYRELFPEQAEPFDAQVGEVLLAGLADSASRDPQLEQIPAAVQALNQLLPMAAQQSQARLAPVIRATLADVVRGDPTLAAMTEPFARYRQLFTVQDAQADMSLQVVAIASVTNLITDTVSFGAVVEPVGRFSTMFPQGVAELRSRLSERVLSALKVLSAQRPGELSGVSRALDDARGLLGADAGQVTEALAPTVAANLARVASATPGDLTAVVPAIVEFRALFGSSEAVLVEALSGPTADGLESVLRQDVTSPRGLVSALTTLRQVFPTGAIAIGEKLTRVALDGLRKEAVSNPTAPQRLADSLTTYRELFPAARALFDTALAPVFADGLERLVRDKPLDFSDVGERLSEFEAMFGSKIKALRARSAVPVISALQAKIRLENPSLTVVASYLRDFEAVFPGQIDTLRGRVAGAVGESVIATTSVGNPEDLSAAIALADEFALLFPQQASALRTDIGQSFADGLERLVRDKPLNFSDVGERLSEFEAMFGSRIKALRARSAVLVISALQAKIRLENPSLTVVASYLRDFEAVFPGQIDTLRGRIAGAVGESVIATSVGNPEDMSAAIALADEFALLFPQQASALRADIGQSMWAAIEAKAEQSISDLSVIGPQLAGYKAAFPNSYEAVSGALATRASRNIQRNARNTQLALSSVAKQLKQFRQLFPGQYSAVASDVANSLAQRIADSKVNDAKQVAALGGALRELASLFPKRHAELSDDLSAKVLSRVRALEKNDPVVASALQRAGTKVFPANNELAAIRIELPLQEVIDGKGLLATARLSAARAKLTTALARDPQHSTIAAFSKALSEREAQGKIAYSKYVKTVKSNPKARQHAKAWRKVRALWADNKAFKEMTPPAPWACTAAKAGRGKRRSCYDKIGRRARDRGPLMVVIPAGGGITASFAINKYEISVQDYSTYCRASKRCKVPRLKRSLPMRNLSAQKIGAYAKWLGDKGGAIYRLPTQAEWQYAANAGGKQPKRDFNCAVVIGGKQLKGLSLLSVQSGTQNGWGMYNYIGNVRELVRDGATFAAAGGSFKDKLQNCAVSLSASHNGTADKVTGFRLLREISQ